MTSPTSSRVWAHPRVGGENWSGVDAAEAPQGSSPRGRGKPGREHHQLVQAGLIPAWAGKTAKLLRPLIPFPAHPRVGGENTLDNLHTRGIHGSSPRGRGKRSGPAMRQKRPRLIPAWAGKTWFFLPYSPRVKAHPRVGGENLEGKQRPAITAGSSPRGRGKPFE